MIDPTQLAQYGPVVVVVAIFLVYMDKKDKRTEERDNKLKNAIDANTKVTDQTYNFLVNLNGSLKRSVDEKQRQARE